VIIAPPRPAAAGAQRWPTPANDRDPRLGLSPDRRASHPSRGGHDLLQDRPSGLTRRAAPPSRQPPSAWRCDRLRRPTAARHHPPRGPRADRRGDHRQPRPRGLPHPPARPAIGVARHTRGVRGPRRGEGAAPTGGCRSHNNGQDYRGESTSEGADLRGGSGRLCRSRHPGGSRGPALLKSRSSQNR
jgi:hypothetical protein